MQALRPCCDPSLLIVDQRCDVSNKNAHCQRGCCDERHESQSNGLRWTAAGPLAGRREGLSIAPSKTLKQEMIASNAIIIARRVNVGLEPTTPGLSYQRSTSELIDRWKENQLYNIIKPCLFGCGFRQSVYTATTSLCADAERHDWEEVFARLKVIARRQACVERKMSKAGATRQKMKIFFIFSGFWMRYEIPR